MNRQRRRRGEERPAGLNLVSLMDIFTILVFFLMVNASEVEVLETATAIKLPDSTSEAVPEERVSIEVSQDQLLLQGKAIANISDILINKDQTILALVSGLQSIPLSNTPAQEGRVIIMGDKALPYELLKRVMLSCQTANYTHIALAVNQVAVGSIDSALIEGAGREGV